ncbi:UNVERIFIED_ORG: hypothetical protein GGD43_006056 [Rhizobium esperanzae]
MNKILTSDRLLIIRNGDAEKRLRLLQEALAADRIVPYLGPDLLRLQSTEPPVPDTPEAVSAALNERTPAPSRIRSNMWSVAQFIEQRRHRRTLQAWMAEIFGAPVAPTAPTTGSQRCRSPLSSTVGTTGQCVRLSRRPVERMSSRFRASRVQTAAATFGQKLTICPGETSNASQRQRRSSMRRTAVLYQLRTFWCPIPITWKS